MKKLYAIITLACLCAANCVSAQSFPCSWAGGQTTYSRSAESVATPSLNARENQYDVKFYFLKLDIERANSAISGSVLISSGVVAATIDTFSIELDASAFTVDSVEARVNGGNPGLATVLSHTGNDLNIDLPFTAHANDMIDVRITYHGTAATSLGIPSGPGVFNAGPNSTTFSASPPYNSSTWWPCKQNLTDKADSSWFFITTDTSSQAISNGVLSGVSNVSATKNQWEWKSKHPINFYLVSFVVGKFDKTVQYFHPEGRTDSMQVEFYSINPGATLDILQKFSSKFGLYPFYDEKFGLASVYLGGGMENQTIVSLGASGSVIEHETMHQWFGDNVSFASYRDLALSEGFARWAESLYPELTSGNPNNTRIAKCNTFETSALGYAAGSVYNHTTDTSSINGLYAGQGYAMYYDKAAMLINSLRFEVNNDSLFFLGLKNYQTAHAGKTVTGNNLRDDMENTTDIDLTDFFDQWYYGYGYPTFSIKWNQQNDHMALQVTQTTSSVNTPLFKTSLEIKVKRLNGVTATDTTIRVFVAQDSVVFNMPMGDSITGFTIDPNQWIVNKTGTIAKNPNLVVEITGINAPVADINLFEVYPNPASQYLIVHSTQSLNAPVDAELYNSVGQRVQYAKISGTQPLNISALPNGVYFLLLNGASATKVVIQR